MFDGPGAVRSENAECVRFVHEYLRVMFLRDLGKAWQVGDGALHREHPVGHHELRRMLGRRRELAIQRGEVTVRIPMYFGEPESCRIDKGGVVEPIEKKGIAAARQCGDRAEARLIACGEDERCFLLEELCESILQLIVKIER